MSGELRLKSSVSPPPSEEEDGCTTEVAPHHTPPHKPFAPQADGLAKESQGTIAAPAASHARQLACFLSCRAHHPLCPQGKHTPRPLTLALRTVRDDKGSELDSIRVDQWNTDTLVEYFKERLA